MTHTQQLQIPAIQVEQTPGQFLYTFAIDGKLVPSFAAVSRIHRNGGTLAGYQRPEVEKHIGDIRDYIDSGKPRVPNAIVVAFDNRVTFERTPTTTDAGVYTRPGTLMIPIDETATDESKPGWIVDGQQRLAAIREAAIAQFPICVTAFITTEVQEQVEQFMLVNMTKPLPKGLIYELLPHTTTPLPPLLEGKRYPAELSDRLNLDTDSPLQGLIKTPTNPKGVMKDNSVLNMLRNSLHHGLLFRFCNADRTGGRTEEILVLLKAFWGAVAQTFPDAWALPPTRSRLMHGAGVVSMGFIMDRIADRYRATGPPSKSQFLADLKPLVPVCRWVEGYWDFGPGQQTPWNKLANTSAEVELLTNYLQHEYKSRVWNEARHYSRTPEVLPLQNQTLLPT